MNQFITTKLMGGLGNCLFQIAAAYSISIRDHKEFICNISDEIIVHTPYLYYKNNIFRKLKLSDHLLSCQIHKEPFFHFSEIPKVDGSIKLDGYFQSEKYFENVKNEIKNLFEISEIDKNYLIQKYSRELNFDTVSLHVRRGNYIGLNYYHENQTIEYYNKAINHLGQDYHFLIFSDDIEWCKQNFQFLKNKTFVEGNLDYQDLYLMSMCNNNIIANSTFSWWGAWMNNNNKVIAPSKWFGSGLSHNNTKDLYCDNWIIL
jgi:hypothetical protein